VFRQKSEWKSATYVEYSADSWQPIVLTGFALSMTQNPIIRLSGNQEYSAFCARLSKAAGLKRLILGSF
jgi:hypothetical protein